MELDPQQLYKNKKVQKLTEIDLYTKITYEQNIHYVQNPTRCNAIHFINNR